MIHFQSSTPYWTLVVSEDPPLVIKAIDRGDLLETARAVHPNTYTILRHWYDHHQVFGGTLEANKERARTFFRTFIDLTFDVQFAPHVCAIEEWNEYLANSQNHMEIEERITWARACAMVWEEEYRTQPLYSHIRLILCNTAVGNIIPHQFAEIALEHDCLLGYHPYTLWENGQRWSGDWDNLSGLFNTLEKLIWPSGLKPKWAFTEAGPFFNAIDGWRHGNCLGGDREAYVAAVKEWVQNVKGTDAYKEGRIVGFTLFNTGNPSGTWKYFETDYYDMVPMAQMVREEWGGPFDPSPVPPSKVYVVPGISYLNYRAGPSTQHSIIGRLLPDKGPFQVISEDGSWALLAAWAHKNWLVKR